MISWLRLLFIKAEEETAKKEEEKQTLNLKKMTKGDRKKLYAQGKIEAKDLRP